MTFKPQLIIAFFISTTLISACKNKMAALEPTVGNYQGNLIAEAPKSVSGDPLQKYAVTADLTKPSDDLIHLEIKGNPSINTSLDLTIVDPKNIKLSIPLTSIQNVQLHADQNCFSSEEPELIRLCSTPTTLAISAEGANHESVYSLSLEYFSNVASDVHLETPQAFTLDQAVTMAMTKNFDTQVEFQHMLQARLNAKAAYAALLPHLNFGSMLDLATGGPLAVIGVLGMAGDLVPFLFPTRWMQAKQSGQLSQAESDALALMRGDSSLNVQILGYSIDHDIQALKYLNKDYAELLVIKQKVADLEVQGLVPEGTSEHLDSIVLDLHDVIDDLAYPLQAEYTSFAQAMGFVNPLAVSSLEVSSAPPTLLNGQTVLKVSDFENLVLERSIELRQMNHLIDAAKIGLKSDYFAWLDPEADAAHSLGFGLGSAIKMDQSQVTTLEIQKNQTASSVLQTLATAVIEYNHSMDDLDDSETGMALQTNRKAHLMKMLDSGKPVSANEITSIPLDEISWQMHYLDGTLDYRTSMAKIERLLLQGHYANLDGSLISMGNGVKIVRE